MKRRNSEEGGGERSTHLEVDRREGVWASGEGEGSVKLLLKAVAEATSGLLIEHELPPLLLAAPSTCGEGSSDCHK